MESHVLTKDVKRKIKRQATIKKIGIIEQSIRWFWEIISQAKIAEIKHESLD